MITYVVPSEVLSFCENRLITFSIPFKKAESFGEQVVQFDDPHGLHIELVARAEGEQNNWTFGGVTPEVVIKGFGSATS